MNKTRYLNDKSVIEFLHDPMPTANISVYFECQQIEVTHFLLVNEQENFQSGRRQPPELSRILSAASS